MIIKKPTYEDMIPFLGRTVTIEDTRSGATKTGCLVSVVFSGSGVYAALYIDGKDTGNSGRIDFNMKHKDKAKAVGPQDVIAFYCPNPVAIEIHEPVKKMFSPSKWWLLAVPVVLRLFG